MRVYVTQCLMRELSCCSAFSELLQQLTASACAYRCRSVYYCLTAEASCTQFAHSRRINVHTISLSLLSADSSGPLATRLRSRKLTPVAAAAAAADSSTATAGTAAPATADAYASDSEASADYDKNVLAEREAKPPDAATMELLQRQLDLHRDHCLEAYMAERDKLPGTYALLYIIHC
jgi:hypothetical protein